MKRPASRDYRDLFAFPPLVLLWRVMLRCGCMPQTRCSTKAMEVVESENAVEAMGTLRPAMTSTLW
jgi:hypothetical protein